LNHALHVAAITQIAHDTPGRVYSLRKIDEGKIRKEALRALKRRISDVIYRQLVADTRPRIRGAREDKRERLQRPAWPAPHPDGRLLGEVTPGPDTNATPTRPSTLQRAREQTLDTKRLRSEAVTRRRQIRSQAGDLPTGRVGAGCDGSEVCHRVCHIPPPP
jgi:hypothetical protein